MSDTPLDGSSQALAAAPTDWPPLPEPDMLERLIQIIAKEAMLDRALIRPESTLETLGLASIDVVSILMGIEEEFDVYVPMSAELQDVRNLHDLIKIVTDAMAHEVTETAAVAD